MKTFMGWGAWVSGILLLLTLGAGRAHADVYINEVAWMGTADSSTNEWIELYNDGSTDVDLDGWVIVADDGSPNIVINKNINSIIGAKKYYLIERTDDNAVPNIPADLVTAFGSGLSNTGEKLFLKKPDSTIVETLDFKSGWPAGDNITKQTMQRVGTSWVTAVATPRALNAGSVTPPPSGGDVVGTSSGDSAVRTETKKEVVIIKPKISIVTDTNIVAHVATNFDAIYTGITPERIVYGYFVWSMGDGATYNFTYQKKFQHTYQYPGDYPINVAYFADAWVNEPIIEISIIAHVSDAGLTIKPAGTDGTIEITNTTAEDISISKWHLISGSIAYTFPYGMKVLAKKSIILAPSITGFSGGSMPTFSYPSGLAYGSIATNSLAQQQPVNIIKTTTYKNKTSNQVANSDQNFGQLLAVNAMGNSQLIQPIDLTANAIDSINGDQKTKNTKWVYFVGVISIFILAYLAMRLYRSRTSIEGHPDQFQLLDE